MRYTEIDFKIKKRLTILFGMKKLRSKLFVDLNLTESLIILAISY